MILIILSITHDEFIPINPDVAGSTIKDSEHMMQPEYIIQASIPITGRSINHITQKIYHKIYHKNFKKLNIQKKKYLPEKSSGDSLLYK